MAHRIQACAFSIAVVIGIVLAGCGGETNSGGGGASMDEMAAAVRAQKGADEQERQEAERQAQEAEQAAGYSDETPADPERRVAGRAPVQGGGYASAAIGARRHILNRVDRLAWLQGVQHFQAEHGRLPRDHEEFMSRVVEFHGIDLGYKEEDQEFLYDPNEGDWGEVFVVQKTDETAQP